MIEREGEGFVVRSTKGEYRTRNVLLSIGRRGTPRKLGVPGEDLPKVVYRLIDPAQYAGKRVLVAGGGDSALEAAASIADIADTHVVLSHRSEAFDRAKPKNRARIEAHERGNWISRVLERFNRWFDRMAARYTHVIRWALRHRWWMLGLATDYCVKFTALDALSLGFRTHVVLDGCRGVNLNPTDAQRAVEEMKAAGVYVT